MRIRPITKEGIRPIVICVWSFFSIKVSLTNLAEYVGRFNGVPKFKTNARKLILISSISQFRIINLRSFRPPWNNIRSWIKVSLFFLYHLQLSTSSTTYNATLNLTGHILLGLGIASSVLLYMFFQAFKKSDSGYEEPHDGYGGKVGGFWSNILDKTSTQSNLFSAYEV